MSVESCSVIREKIVNSLDMNPMSVRQLGDLLEIKPGMSKYNRFMNVLSNLQNGRKNQVLGVSIDRSLKRPEDAAYHPDTFVIYRTDQATILEEAGRLSKLKECPIVSGSENLFKIIKKE
jgi:hypothetical protein